MEIDLFEILTNQREELRRIDVKRLCPREEESQFDLQSPLAQVVIGVRRSGKSTLCQKVLIESGMNFAYVNFDDEQLASLRAEELNSVMNELYRIYGDFECLFLDEVQNVEGWPLFVNRLLRQGYHLVVTGSNANLLSGELATHLTGRYNQITLYPFSFGEYCMLTGVDTESQSTKAKGLRLRALDEYLMQGGLPETYGLKRVDTYVQSLFEAIVAKDICRRYRVKFRSTLSDMANSLVDHFCQEVSYSQLAKQYSLTSLHTAKDYVSYLSNAFLLCLVPKFSFKTTERQQSRKCYVTDLAFVGNRHDVLQSEGYGWRLENVVAIELLRRMEYEGNRLYYIRKTRDYEVDFAVVERSKVRRLVQVTYDFENPSTKLYNREVGGLVKAAKATDCKELYLVMGRGKTEDLQIDGLTIHKVHCTEWLLRR